MDTVPDAGPQPGRPRRRQPRTTAWGFDPNRDFGTQNQQENRLLHAADEQVPGRVLHRRPPDTRAGYFFPPNEDPVHHEIAISRWTSSRTGSARRCSTRSTTRAIALPQLQPVRPLHPGVRRHGPVAADGRGRHDLREGHERGLRASRSTTTTSRSTRRSSRRASDKVGVTSRWVAQWGEAVDQGADCKLQPNKLVSPLHDTIKQQPDRATSAATSSSPTSTRVTRRR